MGDFSVVLIILAVFAIIILMKTAQVVPQRTEAVIERLGKYSRTLSAGFHILIPFLDRIAYKRHLKEEVIEVPKQNCITKDNVQLDKKTLVILRWIALVGQYLTISIVYFIFKFELPFYYCSLVIFAGIVSNSYLQFGFKKKQFRISEEYSETAMSIPIYPNLKKEDQTKIVYLIILFFKKYS